MGDVARRRVLVVEDEPLIGDVLRMMLEDNYDVTVTTSGATAQEILTNDKAFDAILCDLHMSPVSGMALHAWLTEAAPGVAARMVFMTGGAFTAEDIAFERSVKNKFIMKPLAWATVESTVAEVVGSGS
jgi:CheY-like chemotaxis protein